MTELQPNVLTPSNYDDVFAAYERAIELELEEVATIPWVDVLVAQSAFETYEWRAMHDWNLVNLRGAWHGLSTTFKAGELDEHGHEVLLEPSSHNLFRFYPGIDEAARDVVRFLFTQSRPDRPNRYAAAADAARSGDVAGFATNLRGPNPDGSWIINGDRLYGFYTANPRVYVAGCVAAFNRLRTQHAQEGDSWVRGGAV